MPKEPAKNFNILYLTKDPDLIKSQLSGQPCADINTDELLDNISTDAIIPSNYCIQDADPLRLGKYCLTGLPGGIVPPESLTAGHFNILVAGRSFGRGSSREHAQLALIGAGVNRLVVRSSERIFAENSLNYGIEIYPLENPHIQKALLENRPLPSKLYYDNLLPVSKLVAYFGGLMPFVKSRMNGQIRELPIGSAPARPMTIGEKIIASRSGLEHVEPGQQVIARINRGYGYELQNPVTIAALEGAFPEGYNISRPERFVLFEDHLALLDYYLRNTNAEDLRNKQRDFANRHGIPVFTVSPKTGVEGICHTIMVERFCLPGELVLGNDSHTCTLGATGAFAIGKGASEMAAALISGEIILTVPETIRFDLVGKMKQGVTSKDLMLKILGSYDFRNQLVGSGRIFEFGGSGLASLNFDEQLVLTNMAIEGQGATGIIEPNRHTIDYLRKNRNIGERQLRKLIVRSDPDAEYFKRLFINLSDIEPMIALPGDTQNTLPLSELPNKVSIDIAYLGSCTGGKLTDLDMAARVLAGKRISNNVRMYIQASSQSIRYEAEKLGILDVLREAGAEVLPPGCGACMGAGPGSCNNGEVIISDTNRNFSGRMGKNGITYLSNAGVVAASAIKGYITTPERIFDS